MLARPERTPRCVLKYADETRGIAYMKANMEKDKHGLFQWKDKKTTEEHAGILSAPFTKGNLARLRKDHMGPSRPPQQAKVPAEALTMNVLAAVAALDVRLTDVATCVDALDIKLHELGSVAATLVRDLKDMMEWATRHGFVRGS